MILEVLMNNFRPLLSSSHTPVGAVPPWWRSPGARFSKNLRKNPKFCL